MTKTRTVYQTDRDGVYVGETVAFESPLEKGVFMIPAGCVETAPPATTEQTRARWTAKGWVVEPKPVAAPEPAPKPVLPTPHLGVRQAAGLPGVKM